MRHARSFLVALIAVAAALAVAAPALAAPLGTIALEGQLRTVAGSPVPDGDYDLKVSLYKDKNDPKALHSETIKVKVKGGGFLLSLGLAEALKSDIFADGSAAWLGITVGTEAELPRLPLNHVAYAFRAEHAKVAHDLKCSGCLKTEHLDASVLKDYAKSDALKKLVPVDQKCGDGEVVSGFDADGKVQCAKDANDTYSGKNFALASQSCPKGQVVAKIDADGKITCELGGKTYDGKNFATSGQKCPPGQVVASISADGKLECQLDQKGQVSGKDFALSNQSCGKGKVMRGVDSAGKPVCANIAYESGIAADALSKTEVTNLQQGKLADGKTPWTAKAAYSENGEGFFAPTDAKKPFKAQSKGGQMVLRSDSTTEYASGVGKYPFLFMHGGNVAANRTAAIQTDGTVWTKSYGWLHKRFTASNQNCGSGEVVTGVDADGKVKCAKDANSDTKYGAGTFMKMESGNKIGANLSSFDSRYVNEGQGNSVTSAMVKDGDLTGVDIKDSSLTGSDIANGTIDGADLKDKGVGNADLADGAVDNAKLANNAVNSAKIAAGTVTTNDVANESLTGADIKNESLTGSDIDNESLTGADIKNESLTGSDIDNESLTGADIKNGSLGYADTDVNSIQRRVTGSCPTGQAIVGVKNDGTVTCGSVDALALTTGACKAGEWRRIAENGGNRFDGLFILRDSISGGGHSSMTFRMSGAYGDFGNYSFNLLSHGYHSTPTFTQVRLIHKGTYDKNYIEVLCARTGSVSLAIHQNQHSNGFSVVKWALGGIPSGYTARTYNVNHLLAAANSQDRFYVARNGNAWNSGNYSVGGSETVGSDITAGGVIRANKGFNVDGQTVIDDGAGWHRAYGKTGIYNGTYGGGIYMEDSTWVRVYGNKHFLVPGNYKVRADGGFEVDGKTVIDADGGWHRAHGSTGFYFQTHGGGIHMSDSTWVRIHGKKQLLVDNHIYTSGFVGVGDSSPNYPIDIERDSSDWLVAAENKAGNDTNVYLADNDHGIYVKTRHTDTTTGYIAHFRNHTGTAMTIENNRNVGIRTDSPAYTLDVSGNGRFTSNVGIQTTPRSDYALDVGGHVDMSDKNLNYANQVHFNHGNHFYEANDGRYLNYKWASGSHGGIRFYDGDGTQQGYLYGDGDASKPSIGLLDSDGNWAVHVKRDEYVRLLVNSSEKLKAHSSGVTVSGILTAGAITVGSKALSTYIRDYINGSCYIYFGWRDGCNSCTNKPRKAGRVRPGYCQGALGEISDSNSCTDHKLGGNTVRMFGLNTDGVVNGDDMFWIGFRCF